MNAAHLHLMINHLPILGTILGALVLLYGLLTKSKHTKLAGYYLLLIAAAGGLVTYFSGQEAEEIIEHTGAMHEAIEAHEDFAKYALISIAITGIAAIAGLILTKRLSSKANMVTVVTLVLALLSFGVAAYTGQLGGRIMHPETSGELPGQPAGKAAEEGKAGEKGEEKGHEH